MALLEVRQADASFAFDRTACRAAGEALSIGYTGAAPFPHIVIDDFVDPTLLRSLLPEFPSRDDTDESFERSQERLKTQYMPSRAGANLRRFLIELNSAEFIAFLEKLTGITGLIPDPYYMGGGLHETKRGGHLGIHADFNIHPKLKLERRINLLIYLNDDWRPEYAGNLELWDKG